MNLSESYESAFAKTRITVMMVTALCPAITVQLSRR